MLFDDFMLMNKTFTKVMQNTYFSSWLYVYIVDDLSNY